MVKKWLYALIGISGLAIFSRVLGFLRDVLMANMFGISTATDSYLTSYIFFDLLLSINSAVLIGTISFYSNKENSSLLTKKHFFSFLGKIFITSVIIVIIAGLILKYSINDDEFIKSVLFNSIYVFILIAPFCIAGGYYSAIHQLSGNNFMPALLPVFFNVFGILSLIFFGSSIGIVSIPNGIAIGVVIFFMFQFFYPGIKKSFRAETANNHQVTKLWLSGIVLVLSNQIMPNIAGFIDRIFSIFLITGSFSNYSYSTRIYLLPLSIFGLAVSTSILPFLARTKSENDTESFNRLLKNAVLAVIISAGFCFILFVGAGEFLIKFIFEHGKFNHGDTKTVSFLFFIISFAIFPSLITPLIYNIYYILNDTKSLIYNSILNLIVLVIVQAGLLLVFNDARLLTFALLISTWAGFFINFFFLKKKKDINIISEQNGKFLKVVVFSIIMGVGLYFLCRIPFVYNLFDKSSKPEQALLLVIISILIMLFYGAFILAILKKNLRELKQLIFLSKHKM